MGRQLPPLNALRAFEAAARHLSFTKAATELHVTQAAISHQVKALEETLGVMLFRRLNRRLVLTDHGQSYLPVLRDAFDQIDSATRRLYADERAGPLRISALSSFAARWLLPRLPRFRERHPEIDVVVSVSDALIDFSTENIDIGLRYGFGNYPGLASEHLMDDEIFPVCSPKLLAGPLPLRGFEDLHLHTLLHDDGSRPQQVEHWRWWKQTFGIENLDVQRGPGYSDSSLLMQAAIAGQGVALGRLSLALDDMEAGLLVRPFGPTRRSSFSYYMVMPPATAELTKQRQFRDWIHEEVETMRRKYPTAEDLPLAADGVMREAKPS